MGVLGRPAPTADYASPSRARPVGVVIGVLGVAMLTATLIANIVAASDIGEDAVPVSETLAWSFGLTTMGLATVKFGIATILMGIVQRLWLRVESVKAALPELRAQPAGDAGPTGPIDTPYGAGVATSSAPGPLPIHRVARVLWAPMLAMGLMAVGIGLVLSLIQSGTSDAGDFRDLSAWVQGTQFLGEGFLLGGISFLLGTILAAIREGGGEVQESLGIPVQTLRMPLSAKAFVALMATGMMVMMAQFVFYIVATGVDDPAPWFAWLGPLRELGLGLLLAGIVLALYTIGTVLGFQFHRIRSIVETGR
jgi:hypothetical protein